MAEGGGRKTVADKSTTEKPFDINRAGRHFHDTHARCNNPRKSAESYTAFRDVVPKITDELKEQGLISRKEFAGSTWERTSIPKSSDFDVMLMMRDKGMSVNNSNDDPNIPSGYAALRKDDKPCLPSQKMDELKGATQKILNKTDFGNYDVKMRGHGPAVQLDVYGKFEKDMKTSIDLVPTIAVPGSGSNERHFVAKPPKYGSDQPDVLWQNSHSLAAKEKLLTADSDNGCRREAYRTAKVIRNAEPNLPHVTSYQLKTALFNTMDDKPGNSHWGRDKLGERVVDVLGNLQDSYRSGQLNDYYEPGINLIQTTKDDTRINTANRLNRLSENPEKLFDADRI